MAVLQLYLTRREDGFHLADSFRATSPYAGRQEIGGEIRCHDCHWEGPALFALGKFDQVFLSDAALRERLALGSRCISASQTHLVCFSATNLCDQPLDLTGGKPPSVKLIDFGDLIGMLNRIVRQFADHAVAGSATLEREDLLRMNEQLRPV